MIDDGKATCMHSPFAAGNIGCALGNRDRLKYAHPECNEKVSFTDLDGANPKLAGVRNDDRH